MLDVSSVDRSVRVMPPRQNEIRRFTARLMALEPARSSDLHAHEKTEEPWFVITGRGRIDFREEIESVGAGD